MDLFPPIDRHRHGLLSVGDGHHMYWEESGNPQGCPVLFVHGGPGSGTAPIFRRFFDPSFWRIILFDQRGSGQSVPLAETNANTTAHLVADMEALRRHLQVDRWMLFGGSWGSTLALAYGQDYPDRVLGFVLRGVFLFRPQEVEWFLSGMGTFFPEAFDRFIAPVKSDPDGTLHAYWRLLSDPDPRIHQPAAHAWFGWEEACARLIPRPDSAPPDPALSLSMARLECHYMVHKGFMEPDQLLRRIDTIRHLPARIVQGRYDMVCPPISAWDLAQAWPKATLTMVSEAGHSSMEPGIRTALVAAVQGMRTIID